MHRPSQEELSFILAEQQSLPLSYDADGEDGIGRGFANLAGRIEIGRGDGVFHRASSTLNGWSIHRRSGMTVVPSDEKIAEDVCVVLMIPMLRGFVTAACRVVHEIRTNEMSGFTYGTLPHHVERGEESFVVEIEDSERVSFSVRASSRPAIALARAVGPLAATLQKQATVRYLHAMVDVLGEGVDRMPSPITWE
jgi:uncharacterized protein (UPF0548 family)